MCLYIDMLSIFAKCNKEKKKKLRTTSEFLEMLKNALGQVKNMTS